MDATTRTVGEVGEQMRGDCKMNNDYEERGEELIGDYIKIPIYPDKFWQAIDMAIVRHIDRAFDDLPVNEEIRKRASERFAQIWGVKEARFQERIDEIANDAIAKIPKTMEVIFNTEDIAQRTVQILLKTPAFKKRMQEKMIEIMTPELLARALLLTEDAE